MKHFGVKSLLVSLPLYQIIEPVLIQLSSNSE